MAYLSMLVEPVFSKLWKTLVDCALEVKYEATFQSLQNNIKKLNAKAFDVNEEIKKVELLGKKKRKREVHEWLEGVQSMENEFRALENEMQTEGFITRFFGGGRAAELDARISKLVEQSQHFGELLVVCETKGETFLISTGLVGKEFERNLERILNSLKENNGFCIGLYGMGGVGKTTLAQHINNKLVKDSGYSVSWITVSQEFCVTSLQDKIAKDVCLDLSDEDNEDKRAAMLHRVLSENKNRIFIFDDMWEPINLEKVGVPLSGDGCKLMITTRSREVCGQMDCKPSIEVKKLDKEEAWKLFNEVHGRILELSPEVQEIGKSMVKVCDGLPLGIITVAGSMRGETSENVWRDARAELTESVMEREDMKEKVFKVLKYSFDRLGQRDGNHNGYSKLQHCFLHCSLYPEDYQIYKEELIGKFIMEEFMDKRKTRETLFVQGHAILDKLVKACLLEICNIFEVKMHDLVRAMALKIMEGRTKVIAGHSSLKEIPNEEEWTKDLEKMSLLESGIIKIPPGFSPHCSKLSTLLLAGNPLGFIPNSFFLKMCSLCILDLSGTDIKELPDSLSDMEKLSALLLARCWKLEYIPNMGKLKQLREVDFSGTAICEVPPGMEEATNLKSLLLHGIEKVEMLPSGFLLNFEYLQCLGLPYHIEVVGGEIENLNHVEEFSGRVKDINVFNLLVSKNREGKSYRIVVGSNGSSFEFVASGGSRHHLLPRNRSKKRYIDDDVIVLRQGMQRVELDGWVGGSNCIVEKFATVGLEVIMRCEQVEELYVSGCEEVERLIASTSPLPNHVSFYSLKLLWIMRCKKMKKVGLTTSQLPNLEEMRICNCEALEELLEVSNSGTALLSLPKLTELILIGLPRLTSICNTATIACPSIKRITLRECGALKKLPLVFEESDSPPSTLKEIRIDAKEKEWWERMELGHPTHKHLLQPFLTFFLINVMIARHDAITQQLFLIYIYMYFML